MSDAALTTLKRVNRELGYSTGSDNERDLLIRDYIEVATDLFTKMSGIRFHKHTVTEKVGQPASERRLIVSEALPILSVTSIKLDGELIDASEYEVERASLGWIRRKGSSWDSTTKHNWGVKPYPQQNELLYEVVYLGGYATPHQVNEGTESTRTLPHDVEQAVVDYVSFKLNQRHTDSTVKSQSTGDWSVTYRDGVVMPTTFEDTIKRYKVPKVMV
jgi:hypothetical protein